MRLDHLVIGCGDLDEGVAWAEAQLGVALLPGGRHERFGTHNRLLRLGDLYLEVIAIEPGASCAGPRWFGLDGFEGAPRLITWVCAVPDLDAAMVLAPDGKGHAVPVTRGELNWRITVPEDGCLPMDGAYPTLIQWGDGVVTPPERLADSGLRLDRLTVRHPEGERIAGLLPLTDSRVRFETGALAISARLTGPAGEITL
ncbi:VOC family protein [Pelagovum pacificum]|uniref:VOC family protein n=1 Tax=Pelagovum pacificum TaxID=2588711 RepID=A0A5C5GB54_9RHOB|nr:VOC family protein [Pelagovum pacificum]QQA41316.1 VOC family protein [Pelagovum pacificum]TNY31878.1 VOC family protein [Pelagovum pacificum]